MPVLRIISGGQTGADQGGLLAATRLNLLTGGTAPKGWRTDAGPMPELAKLGLVEHASPAYPPRTECNVLDSDGTLLFGNLNSPRVGGFSVAGNVEGLDGVLLQPSAKQGRLGLDLLATPGVEEVVGMGLIGCAVDVLVVGPWRGTFTPGKALQEAQRRCCLSNDGGSDLSAVVEW